MSATTFDGAWDLSPADRLLVEAKRWGSRLRFAVMLLFYRARGRFPRAAAEVDEGAVTLAHALMSRSYCVKSEDSLHPERAVRLACWAGDRFEITTISRMQPGKGWQDVSSSLTRELLKHLACPKKE